MESMNAFDETLEAKKAKKTLEANDGLGEFLVYLHKLLTSDQSRFSVYGAFSDIAQIHDEKLNVIYQLDAKAIPFVMDALGNYVNL